MIFKTFNSDIDKISSKWGMFGKSFNDIGTAIIGRITDINKAFQATNDLVGSIKDSDSIWKRLYSSKESINEKLIDIDSLYPERTDSQFSSLLSNLVKIEEKVKSGSGSWQKYFNGLGEGEKWQIEFVQNTDLQKASLSDVKKAYDSARASALAHNEAIKAQTFSAKAGKVALQALAMAGNMIAMWAISKAISFAAEKLYEFAHAAENAKEKAKTSKEELDSLTSEISNLNKELETTRDRIQELLEKSNSGSLSIIEEEELDKLKLQNDELQREISLKEKLAEIDAKEAADNAAYSLTYRTDDNKWDDEYNATDRIDKLQKYVDSANFYQDKLSEINQQILDIEESATDNSYKDDSVYKDLIKHQTEYQEGLKKVEEQMSSIYKELSDEDDGLYYNGKIIDGYEELASRLDTVYTAVKLYLDEESADSTAKEYIDSIKSKFMESGLSEEISNKVLEGFSEEELSSIVNSDSIDWSQFLNLDEATDIIENIREQLASINPNETNIKTFDQAWADSYTSESDAVKELANNLLGLAEQGRLTKETFEEADSTAGDYFKNLGISADEAISKINKLVDESKQLSSMASQISSISNALGTKQEDGFVSADTLAGFDVEVHGLDSWDRFQKVLGSTASSYEECQEAANALATEWVNDSNFLAQLTEENKEYYETQLQAMGVENYEEVIEYAQELNSAKEALAQASFDAATATEEEIQSLIDEGAYSELAQQQIWNLALAKQTEEGITLDSSADCQNLLALAQNAGVTGTAIELLTQLLEIYNNLAAGTYGTNAQVINAVKNKAESLKNQINDLLVNGANSDTVELDPRIKVSPSAKSAAKSAGKETGKSYEEGLEEELSDLESVISGITGKIDDQISVINEQKSAALDAISEEKEKLEEAKENAIAALEEERQKRLEVIETQKNQLEKQIKAKQDEIDKINEAASARQRELDLQRAQFELEKMQNQRTKLVNNMPDTIVI